MARVESTQRIKIFLDKLRDLHWQDTAGDIKILQGQVLGLVQAEIDYYYGKRVYKRKLSGWLRAITVFFGSLGILTPLVKNTGHFDDYIILPWGYLYFAAAGICFTIDKVFTGASGHMRYVVTQIKLEEVTTLFNLKWHKKLASAQAGKQSDYDELFDLLMVYATDVYNILSSETLQWKEELTKAIEEITKKYKQ